MFFNEGGWPEGVDCTDPEQTARFRKRTEKEEVLQLSPLPAIPEPPFSPSPFLPPQTSSLS